MIKYLLDANIFIEAFNRYYEKDIVPTFWKWSEKDDEVYTIKEVIDEIKKNDDGLIEYIKKVKIPEVENQKKKESINTVMSCISNFPDKNPNEYFRFSDGADLFLIATAHALKNKDVIIVTHEVKVDQSSTKIKIPNVCEKLDIKCLNTFDVLKKKKICLSDNF